MDLRIKNAPGAAGGWRSHINKGHFIVIGKWIPLGIGMTSLYMLILVLGQSIVGAAGESGQSGDREAVETVERLSAKSRDWSEPSQASEDRYVKAFTKWLGEMPEPQQGIARKILGDCHPRLSELRRAIREKKAELASLSFDRGTSPETLSRLGVELRALQTNLRSQLKAVAKKLREEAGIDMGKLDRQTFWLFPPTPPETAN